MGKEKPLVSVIIPVYNTQDYLKACIESVQNQTYPNLEILLAHDIYEYGCSAQPMDSRKAWDELVRTANARIRAEREKNPNAYDMDGFYWYYSMNPEATDALHADNGAVAVLLQELAGEA